MADAYIELLKNPVDENVVYPVTAEDAVLDPTDNQPSIPKLKNEISELNDSLDNLRLNPSLNFLDNTEIILGKYPNIDNGNLNSNSEYLATEYIVIRGLRHFRFENVSSNVNMMCFYDKNKKFISGTYNTTAIDVPDNAYYLRIGIPIVDKDTIVFTGLENDITGLENDITGLENDITKNIEYYNPTVDSTNVSGSRNSYVIYAGFINKTEIMSIDIKVNRDETFAGAAFGIYLLAGDDISQLKCVDKVLDTTAIFHLRNYNYDSFLVAFNGAGVKYKAYGNTDKMENYTLLESAKIYNIGDVASFEQKKIFIKFDINIQLNTNLKNTIAQIDERILKLENESAVDLKRTIINVAKEGEDFETINEALKYAYSIESKTNPITILIYPGTYNEVCNIKGKHYISLIGVNRNDCIIRDDTGIYNNCPLRIEGNSYVANLTLIATHKNNPGIVKDNIVQDNLSYGLHIDDRHADDDNEYKCTVENCFIYSEQNPAVGIGLDKNQIVELINCEIVSNISDDVKNATGKLDSVWGWKSNGGALFYHALYSGSYTSEEGYQKLVVKNCTLRNNAPNVAFGEAGGMEKQVVLEFIGNSGWSDENGATFVKGLSKATISQLSFGNNCENMNYKNIE